MHDVPDQKLTDARTNEATLVSVTCFIHY